MSEIRAALSDLVSTGKTSPARLGAAFGEFMDGQASPATTAGLLVALRMKGETVDEIVAVARATWITVDRNFLECIAEAR